jgi:hypothetical protein
MNFQTLHPATELWWTQRDTCSRCEHCHEYEGRGGEGVMRCIQGIPTFCIDARLEGQPCGPAARLFSEK